jgi:hypothetical protein
LGAAARLRASTIACVNLRSGRWIGRAVTLAGPCPAVAGGCRGTAPPRLGQPGLSIYHCLLPPGCGRQSLSRHTRHNVAPIEVCGWFAGRRCGRAGGAGLRCAGGGRRRAGCGKRRGTVTVAEKAWDAEIRTRIAAYEREVWDVSRAGVSHHVVRWGDRSAKGGKRCLRPPSRPGTRS